MRRLVYSAAALVLLFSVTSSVAAFRVTIGTNPANHYPGFNGGVFDATSIGDPLPGAQAFQTFCIETDEYLNDGGSYYVKISDEAWEGGVGGGSPDPLSPHTAYLYYTFRTNPAALNSGLTGTASFTGTLADQQLATQQLQQAIWYLENENGGVNNDLVSLAVGQNWSTIGNVRVMQLYGDAAYTDLKQDLLMIVPAPAAALLAAFGVSLAGWIKRRVS